MGTIEKKQSLHGLSDHHSDPCVVLRTGNVIAPYDPAQFSTGDRFESSSLQHLMGTDNYGRDLFSRVLYGGRISLLVSVLAVVIALIVGGLMGTTAGYFGGIYETIVMRITDILMAIPSFLMALCVSVALGTGVFKTAIAIAASAVPSYARVTRASVLSEKTGNMLRQPVPSGLAI